MNDCKRSVFLPSLLIIRRMPININDEMPHSYLRTGIYLFADAKGEAGQNSDYNFQACLRV